MRVLDPVELAQMIDLTLVKPLAFLMDIENLCRAAVRYRFICVMVNSCYVKLASRLLSGTDVRVGTVVGFPLGANLTEVKVFEAKRAIELGASEIDMVINLGFLKSGNIYAVEEDIRAVVEAVKSIRSDAVIKVIIETCYLTDDEKIEACRASVRAGADFVKTSTGFGSGGATVHDVELMRRVVGPNFGVKAAGGIRDLNTALKMIEAGANRIGASAGVRIIEELIARTRTSPSQNY